MEIQSSSIESLFERVEAYTKTTYELSKLKLLETVMMIVTSLVPRVSTIIVFLLFALVLNIGIALFLGELLGKSYWGFFIVAAFYFVVGMVMHFFLHRWIKKPLSDSIINQALQ